MLLLCNQNHKEVAFEGTNRELDCPVCKALEERAADLAAMGEKGALIRDDFEEQKKTKPVSIRPRKLTEEQYVPYGGTPYTSRDEGRPYGGGKR